MGIEFFSILFTNRSLFLTNMSLFNGKYFIPAGFRVKDKSQIYRRLQNNGIMQKWTIFNNLTVLFKFFQCYLNEMNGNQRISPNFNTLPMCSTNTRLYLNEFVAYLCCFNKISIANYVSSYDVNFNQRTLKDRS